MSEVWYTGPVAKAAGKPDLGADLGFEVGSSCSIRHPLRIDADVHPQLAAAFAAVAYPPMRWLEIRLTGR